MTSRTRSSPLSSPLSSIGALLVLGTLASAQLPYQAQILTWKAQDALDPPPPSPVVFVGSSSIRYWERLTRDFAHYDVVQRGFGGSQFSDLNLWVDELVLDYDPSAVVVFEGTNDVAAGESAASVFADYLSFVQLVRDGQDPGQPPIPILFIGITPTPARWSLWPIASSVNAMVEAHAAGDPSLFYLDVPTPFLATGMPPSSALFNPDQLHLNQSGYDLWTSVIRPGLEAALPPTRTYRPNPQHPGVGGRILFDLGPDDHLNGLATASPDANGNRWNNWFALPGAATIYGGEHKGDLLEAEAGLPTGIGLVMTAESQCNGLQNGGLTTPSSALLGRFAVPTATADYFFGDGIGTPFGFLLHGLDPALAYDLRFFASRTTSELRITRLRVSGRETLVADLQTSGPGSSGGGGLGNDDTVLCFERVRPDRFGQLFVDVERLAGSFAYLALLEIEVVRPLARQAPPPTSAAGSTRHR